MTPKQREATGIPAGRALNKFPWAATVGGHRGAGWEAVFVFLPLRGTAGMPAEICFLVCFPEGAAGGHKDAGWGGVLVFSSERSRWRLRGAAGIRAQLQFLMILLREATGGHFNTARACGFDLNHFFLEHKNPKLLRRLGNKSQRCLGVRALELENFPSSDPKHCEFFFDYLTL